MQVLIMRIYCAAGTAKLRASGFAWISSDNLRNLILVKRDLGQPRAGGLVFWIAGRHWACVALASAVVAVEISMPLVLFKRRLGWFLLPAMFGLQVGMDVLRGIRFRQFLLSYVFWIPWGRVGR